MGRYLAIIQDSYREAIASRVLMMMIVVSLVTVVLFAGIGWWKVEKHSITLLEREGKIWLGLSARDDRDGVLLTATDNTGPAKDVPSGIGVYLTAIDGISLSKRDQLRDLSNNWKSGQKIELTVQIPWISIFSWELGDSSTELGLLNSIPTRVKISYIQSWIHSWIVNWLGVVAGLIVTAGFMPRFLESGGLHLVLARPVSRTGVIVARFIGGLSFMALFTSTLIFGLFLALGLRSGVWTPSALWAIPLMLFSFAQFYAVSCLCAIITRNTIVAIVVSVTFYFISMLFNFSNFIINAALTAGTSEGPSPSPLTDSASPSSK
jgi:ABC-type transport system involved in multi-copper enzyme maturation permease subunit